MAMNEVKKHTLNIMVLIGAILLFCYGMWQHDMACGSAVWDSGAWKGEFYFWYPYLKTNIGGVYDITLALMMSAFVIAILSLWFWDGNSTYRLSIDPPRWKIWLGFLVIVISDLYVGLQSLEEGMSIFQLEKAIILLILHALMFGFMFLQKQEEEKKE